MPNHDTIDLDTYGALSKGFEATNPISLGVNVSKGNVQSVLGTLSGLAVKGLEPVTTTLGIGQALSNYGAEKAAQTALGQDRDVIGTISGMVGFTDSALDTARGLADTNKDGIVSQREAQNFGMSKGLTSYDVGLNPQSGYGPNSVSIQGLAGFGKTDPSGGVGGINTTGQVADRMTQKQVDDMFSGINTTSGVTGLGGGKGASYSGVLGFQQNPGVDTTGQQGQQTGTQTSHSGKGISFSDDAATSDQGTTYICTALYELGDMDLSIFKYDQRYGSIVNRRTYNGYAIWGKYLAKKIKNKGLIYKLVKPIALRWAQQMAYNLSNGKVGKKNLFINILKYLGETICYIIGSFITNKGDKNGTHNRNRKHGEKRGTIHGKDGVPKRRGRPRTKR